MGRGGGPVFPLATFPLLSRQQAITKPLVYYMGAVVAVHHIIELTAIGKDSVVVIPGYTRGRGGSINQSRSSSPLT